MAMEKKKKVSDKTTEIITKNRAGIRKLSKFLIASTVVIAGAGAVGAGRMIADRPTNIKFDKDVVNVNSGNNHGKENGRENGIEKFAGMSQEQLDKALIDAAGKGDGKEVELLIRVGADIDARTAYGWTPLMVASKTINDDAALMLISSNANIDAKNNMGMTALMVAAMCGRTTIVDALLDAGADKDAKDDSGRTAHDFAVKYGMNKTAEIIENHSDEE